MKNYFCLLLLLTISAVNAASESTVSKSLSASYTSDDNVNHAINYYEAADSIISLDATMSYQVPINISSYCSFKGTLSINQYQDYDKLSNIQPSIELSYHIRPNSGYTATRYSISLAYQQNLSDSEQREGSATTFAVNASKRVTDRVTLRTGINKENISANEKTFNADNTQRYIDANYRLTENNTSYLTFIDFDGDIASSNPSLYAPGYYYYDVWDDVFFNLTPDYYAYSIAVDASSLTIGNSYAIDFNRAIDVSMTSYDASAYGGTSYEGFISTVSYLVHF